MSANFKYVMLRLRPKPKSGESLNDSDLIHTVIEDKLDGHRVTIIKDAAGISAYGRKTYIDIRNQIDKCVPGLFGALNLKVGGSYVVDGEITHGDHSTDVATALARGLPCEFHPFAVPNVNGKWVTWQDNDSMLHRLSECGFRSPTRIHGLNTIAALNNYIAERRVEGVVIKSFPWSVWYKLKPVQTLDVIVTEYVEGNSKYEGMLGTLGVSAYSHGQLRYLGRLSGGFSDKQRAEITPDIIGSVIEIQTDGYCANGGIRFARFLRMRPDKPQEECTLE